MKMLHTIAICALGAAALATAQQGPPRRSVHLLALVGAGEGAKATCVADTCADDAGVVRLTTGDMPRADRLILRIGFASREHPTSCNGTWMHETASGWHADAHGDMPFDSEAMWAVTAEGLKPGSSHTFVYQCSTTVKP